MATRGLLALAAALCCALSLAVPARAALSVDTGGSAVHFTGQNAGSIAARNNFLAAAGAVNNGETNGEQGSGYRYLNWDGSLQSPQSPYGTPINAHTRAASPTELEPWGLELASPVAVADDGFVSVNPHATFIPFTSPDMWAPFNSNTAEFDVVAPNSGPGFTASPEPAVTRGLGIMFINVGATGPTTIQYYNGDILLDSVTALVSGSTAPSFAGLLFPNPVVNRVVVTLGSATIFSFSGGTPTAGGTDPTTLTAADDTVLPEPAPENPPVTQTVGIGDSSVLDTFTDTNAGATPSNFTATVDWGDGTSSPGTISEDTSGPVTLFHVTGPVHYYTQAGTYTAKVVVSDYSSIDQVAQTTVDVLPRPSTTAVSCAPSTVAASAVTTCTATVSDASLLGYGVKPSGVVTFSSPTAGASFPAAASCTMITPTSQYVNWCSVQFAPGPSPAQITASWAGDGAHPGSSGTTTVGVSLPPVVMPTPAPPSSGSSGPPSAPVLHCSLKTLSPALRSQGLAALVTCNAKTRAQVTVQARVGSKARYKAFQVAFGRLQTTVSAGRPTVLVIKAAPGVLSALRAALGHHQRVSLKLTLTAGSQATTTIPVAAIRP